MTETSIWDKILTESSRLMRGADKPFSEYTCERCTEKINFSRLQRVRPLYRQDFMSLKGFGGDLKVKQGGTAIIRPCICARGVFYFQKNHKEIYLQ